MEHEGQALSRGQGLEDDQQGEPNRVGQERLLLRLGRGRVRDEVRRDELERILATRAPGPQAVKAEAGDDRRQPGAEIVDVGRAGA